MKMTSGGKDLEVRIISEHRLAFNSQTLNPDSVDTITVTVLGVFPADKSLSFPATCLVQKRKRRNEEQDVYCNPQHLFEPCRTHSINLRLKFIDTTFLDIRQELTTLPSK